MPLFIRLTLALLSNTVTHSMGLSLAGLIYELNVDYSS